MNLGVQTYLQRFELKSQWVTCSEHMSALALCPVMKQAISSSDRVYADWSENSAHNAVRIYLQAKFHWIINEF